VCARHVERVVSRRDVTSQVEFGLMFTTCGMYDRTLWVRTGGLGTNCSGSRYSFKLLL